eukprot:2150992-Amphidinium_carterae.1
MRPQDHSVCDDIAICEKLPWPMGGINYCCNYHNAECSSKLPATKAIKTLVKMNHLCEHCAKCADLNTATPFSCSKCKDSGGTRNAENLASPATPRHVIRRDETRARLTRRHFLSSGSSHVHMPPRQQPP